MSIIKSLLDTDAYKFTMGMAVYHTQPDSWVRIKFNCRNKGIKLGFLAEQVKAEVKALCKLKFSDNELVQLQEKMPYLKDDYMEFLRLLQLNYKYITIRNVNGELEVEVYGPWAYVIWFEVPVLAIVNELYFAGFATDKAAVEIEGHKRLMAKLEKLQYVDGLKYADFGTRRRYSHDWQNIVIRETLKFYRNIQRSHEFFVGTSNVYFAIKYNLPAIGTMAHEWFQGHQQAKGVSLADFQKVALERWSQEYRGLLGIALSDIIGFDAFLKDFDLHFSKLFDGCRHDSGDPFAWCEKLISHYIQLGIDPRTKTAVFSDGLDVGKMIKLFSAFSGRIKVSFGIGTNLTNDMGLEALQIVMKIIEQNGNPTAKLSDSKGKGMCEQPWFEDLLRKTFNLENNSDDHVVEVLRRDLIMMNTKGDYYYSREVVKQTKHYGGIENYIRHILDRNNWGAPDWELDGQPPRR